MQRAPIKPTIEDDALFRNAVDILSNKNTDGGIVRGFFLTAFVADPNSGEMALHTHQEASEQMIECMLREIVADPYYRRALWAALENFKDDEIGDTAGSA